MPEAEQPQKQLDDFYDKWKVYRELEAIHRRLNDLLVASTVTDAATTLKENYVGGDLGTAAEIATAINTTNARVNDIAKKLNSVLEKIRLT